MRQPDKPPVEPPPIVTTPPAASQSRRGPAPARSRRPSLLAPALVSLATAGVFAVVGVFLSQYAPIFAGDWARAAQPWTEYKMTLIPSHVIGGALLGAFVGARLWSLFRRLVGRE